MFEHRWLVALFVVSVAVARSLATTDYDISYQIQVVPIRLDLWLIAVALARGLIFTFTIRVDRFRPLQAHVLKADLANLLKRLFADGYTPVVPTAEDGHYRGSAASLLGRVSERVVEPYRFIRPEP